MSNEDAGESFDAFFREVRGRLVSQAYVLTGDIHSAQDLAQATLECAWRHWAEVSSYERPAAWARRVLFNLAVNQHKRSSREEPLDEHDQVDRAHEDHVALVEALRTLPSTQQQALVLHDGVGLTVAEVASEPPRPGRHREGMAEPRTRPGGPGIGDERARNEVAMTETEELGHDEVAELIADAGRWAASQPWALTPAQVRWQPHTGTSRRRWHPPSFRVGVVTLAAAALVVVAVSVVLVTAGSSLSSAQIERRSPRAQP